MSKYESYTREQLEELFSSFLIDSWSFSKVACFARNEKDFERIYIYGEKGKRSVSSIAGNAYHEALKDFFVQHGERREVALPDLETLAYNYIEEIPANVWKLQKTYPTVEECKAKAVKSATSFLRNFYGERILYTDAIAKVLGVELPLTEWVAVNGVDIPLPCHAIIDLVFIDKEGKVIIVDHKSRSKYTEDEEMAFVCGKQAITYALCAEAHFGVRVDEVWFVENKDSLNKDKSAQLKKFLIRLDNDTRRLYESLLYEPLRRMIQAVSDPDYVYVINDNDNMADRADLYRFWAKTMIAEVDDFNVPDGKKALIAQRQKKIRDASLAMINPKTISSFEKRAASFIHYDLSDMDMTNSEKIEHVLRTFGILVKVAHELKGYSSNTYLLEISAGVKIANIMKYKLDIANVLNVPSVRIADQLGMYEGKSYVVVESSHKQEGVLEWKADYLVGSRLPIGIDNFGEVVYWDIDNQATPHLLVCGATGSGKSVSIISTLQYALEAGITDIYIFDPKYEFTRFNGMKIKVYNEIEDIETSMRKLVEDMQRRAKAGVSHKTLVIFDEFADAVAAAKSGKELDIKEQVCTGMSAAGMPKFEMKTVGRLKSLEENLKMLLQKGRSLGFRIIAATQRASTKVITGDAKVNLPVQICFRVPKEVDSKVVLDESGAESLNGRGDGLMRSPEYPNVIRFQGFYYV